MTFQDLENTVKKYMLLKDPSILKVICAAVQANKMQIPPPWLAIIGSSSGGKSMLLDALHDVQGITEVDDLTTNTFISGFKGAGGANNSLLLNLPPNPMLLMKDFTTFLGKDDTSRSAIAGQLRKVFDGDFTKRTGTGDTPWEGKVGFLCGTTTSIYTAIRKYAAMGERMIFYHLEQPDAKEVSRLSTKRILDLESKPRLRQVFAEYLNNLPVDDTLPEYPEELHEELIDLADLATRARSSVERNEYSRDKEIIMTHDREMPMRLLKNIMAFGYGFMSINGGNELTPADKKALYHMALSSIPMNRKLVMNLLAQYVEVKAEDIAIRLRLSPNTVQHTLEDLIAFAIVDKSKGMGNMWVYNLRSDYKLLLSKFEGIITTNDTMTDSMDEIVEREVTEVTLEQFQNSIF